MYLLIKGRLGNFVHSLVDYWERRSGLIRHYPPGVLLWGARRHYSYFAEGVNVLLYISRETGFPGGVVLYGELLKPEELRERYWPEGEWPVLLPIKVIKMAKGVAENPRDPGKWRVTVTYKVLDGLGVRLMPSPGQKLSDEVARKIIEML